MQPKHRLSVTDLVRCHCRAGMLLWYSGPPVVAPLALSCSLLVLLQHPGRLSAASSSSCTTLGPHTEPQSPFCSTWFPTPAAPQVQAQPQQSEGVSLCAPPCTRWPAEPPSEHSPSRMNRPVPCVINHDIAAADTGASLNKFLLKP